METSFDHYSLAREAFACGQFICKRKSAPIEALLQITHPTSSFVPSLDHPLRMAYQCQLALLWAIAGHFDAASELASRLKPLIERGFLALWTSEKEYNEEEAKISARLLMRSLGLFEMDRPENPFFAYLYDKNPQIEFRDHPGSDLVLCNEVQAGAFRVGKVYVPAFGPQMPPFSNSDSFGICAGKDGWICAKGAKECWFQMEKVADLSFTLQSISNIAVPFAFYVRADECVVGEKIFKPKSLQRLVSKASSVRFKAKGESVVMGFDCELSIELIPLSGETDLWGASFLLAFQIPPMSPKLKFSVI